MKVWAVCQDVGDVYSLYTSEEAAEKGKAELSREYRGGIEVWVEQMILRDSFVPDEDIPECSHCEGRNVEMLSEDEWECYDCGVTYPCK